MTSDSDIWVGDLVRGLRALSPANESARNAIAALLGLAAPRDDSSRVRGPSSVEPAARDDGRDPGDSGTETSSDESAPEVFSAPDVTQELKDVLDPVTTELPALPKSWATVDALPPPDARGLSSEPTHTALFDPRWQREIAVAITAQLMPLGLVDVRSIVARAARGQPVVRVPRRRRWSVSRGLQLLVDVGAGMEPFRRDQAAFANVVKSVVGQERVEVIEFEGAPLRGVYTGMNARGHAYRAPDNGVPILALTNLGLGGPVADASRATADEWCSFASRVARTSPRVVALVPYPPDAVPLPVRQSLRALYWNRTTAHRHIREAWTTAPGTTAPPCPMVDRGAAAQARELATLVSPAVFIEPELLRAMRVALMPSSGPEIEAAVWFGPYTRTRNASGIVFGREAADRLRTSLREWWKNERDRRPRLTRAREVLDRLHRDQSPALRLEERLAWHAVTGDMPAVERELERVLKAQAQGGRPGIARWAAQAWARMPAEARATSTGWVFYQLARTGRPQELAPVAAMPAIRREDVAAALAFVPDVKVGVRRQHDTLEVGNLAGPGAVAIMVPDLEPRVLDLLEPGTNRQVVVRSKERAELKVGTGPVRIRTMRGLVYALAAPSPTEGDSRQSATGKRTGGETARTSWGHTRPSWELRFDERGHVLDGGALPRLRSASVTDLLVLVHGWNSDVQAARATYDRLLHGPYEMLETMSAQSRQIGALGVLWPSVLWPEEGVGLPGGGSQVERLDDPETAEVVQGMNSEQRRALDETARVFEKDPGNPAVVERMRGILGEHAGRPPDRSHDSPESLPPMQKGDKAESPEAGGGGFLGSLWGGAKNVLRMATYYQMRQRAGMVGKAGLGPFLAALATSQPDLRVHLIAHSVGARLACHALVELSRLVPSGSPVKSLVLLQAIVSNQAFAPASPLAATLRAVDGPVIVTYSQHDKAAGTVYELVTRVAGGDDDGPGASARGALGHDGAQGVPAVRARLGPVGHAYAFEPGRIVNVDATATISGHSDIFSPEIAWLVLAAARAAPLPSSRSNAS